MIRNVFDAILETGHDENFEPTITDEFCPTDAPAGSSAKLKSFPNVFAKVSPSGIRKIVFRSTPPRRVFFV